MKKSIIAQLVALALLVALTGCGTKAVDGIDNLNEVVEDVATPNEADSESQDEIAVEDKLKEVEATGISLEDGDYLVKFDTDSSMFHVNEMMDGKALLSVKDGKGNLHLIMPSKNVLHLYKGMAEDAEKNEPDWINPLVEEVTYDDGMTDEVFTFDVPVEVMDEEFDLALIGKKEVWYDHKVSISNPEPTESISKAIDEIGDTIGDTIEVALEGGTGKAYLISPTAIKSEGDGYLVTIEWSSKNYDYMIVDGEKYLPVAVDEHSIYEIPVKSIDEPLNVIADTVAMSTPHEIEYTITFNRNSNNK